MSLDEAVIQTWTRKQSDIYGFTNAVIETVQGTAGNYTQIYVLFSK